MSSCGPFAYINLREGSMIVDLLQTNKKTGSYVAAVWPAIYLSTLSTWCQDSWMT